MKTKRYMCIVCTKTYTSLKTLKNHTKRHSNKYSRINKIVCDVCGFKTVNLQVHKEMMHSKQCIICSYVAKNGHDLENHEVQYHSGKYECFTCFRIFSTETDFLRHTHISDKNIYKIKDENLKTILLENFYSFKTHSNIGKIIKTYNVSWNISPINSPPNWKKSIWAIYKNQKNPFKINFSHSFILKNRETQVYNYFHSSYSNHLGLLKPKLISNFDDMKQFIKSLEDNDFLELVNKEKTESKQRVYLIVATTFYLASLKNKTLGFNIKDIPIRLRRMKTLLNFDTSDKRKKFDGLCLFRCISFLLKRPIENARHLYIQWAKKLPPKHFKGVPIHELSKIENFFHIAVNVYSFVDKNFTDLEQIRQGTIQFERQMNILQYKNHVFYITDINYLGRYFVCRLCEKYFQTPLNLTVHKRICNGTDTITIYPGGVYEKPKTIGEKLKFYNISIPTNFHYPYRLIWDIESFQNRSNIPNNISKDKTVYFTQHNVMSIACVSNVPGYTQPKFFILEDNEDILIEKFITYVETVSDFCYHQLKSTLKQTFEDLDKIAIKQQESENHVNIPITMLSQQLESYLRTLPVIGFNSGSYDLNVIKSSLLSFFNKKSEVTGKPLFNHMIKKGNNFVSLSTNRLVFLDISNYVGRNCNLSLYLKTFKASQSKGFFPYEYITDILKLQEKKFPPHSSFFSHLKNQNISHKEYISCKKLYQRKGMKTLKDYLIYYMYCDTVPFLEAVNNHCKVFEDMNIDMFKVAVSSPGLSQYLLFQTMNDHVFFSLVNARFSYIHNLMMSNLCGGPSLIYHRLAIRNQTSIPNSNKICKKIIGYDCNSLYLWALTQNDMPTGFPTVRRKENNFQLEHMEPFGRQCREWLTYLSVRYNLNIQHKFNNKERQIGAKKIRVDGYENKKRIIFNFHGCSVHGHKCKLTRGYKKCPITGLDLDVLNKKTREIREYLKSIPNVTYVEIYECQWKNIKKKIIQK